MMFFKLDLYFLICLIFCVYNLQILVRDGRKFVYQNSELDVNETYFSLCIILEVQSYDCSSIDQIANSSIHDACLKMRNLSENFESGTFSPRQIIDQAKRYKIDDFFSFNDRIISPKINFYLNLQSICMAYVAKDLKRLENEPTYINLPLVNKYFLESKILFHNEHPYPIITRGYMFECIQFHYCPSFIITIKMYDLELLPAPFSSNCVDYSKLKFKFERYEKIRSRPDCIMECMKANYRLSLFYYSSNDNDVLKFNPEFPPASKELSDNYGKCLETCSNFCCFSRNFFVFGYKHVHNESYSIVRHHYQVMNYKAIPYLYRYTYALQFLGFIALVFGSSILTMLSKIEIASKKNLKLKNVLKIDDRTVTYLKRGLFGISLSIAAALELQYYCTFKSNSNYSHIFRAYTPIYPTKFTAVLCYNMSICLDENTRLENTTLKHLESLPSCDFKMLSRNPQAQFEDSLRDIRVLREKSIYRTIDNFFFKCFSMNLNIVEARHKSILFGTSAVINMTTAYRLYLVDYMSRLDYETRFFRIGFKIKHVTNEIRTFSNCTTYKKTDHNCESQRNCVDKCYQKSFLKKYKTLPMHSIIYAEYYKNDKNLRLNASLVRDEDIWSACLHRFRIPDCDYSAISTHDKQIGNDFVAKGKIIYLNLMIEHTVNTLILLTNQREVVFHLLTVGSVLFGLSYPKLIHFLIDSCKSKHLNFLKGKKVIFVISILGAVYHTYNILDDAINSDLIPEYSSNFDFLEPNKHLPTVIFCTEHRVNLDGATITGRELDNRTSHITNSYIFEKIVYYDLELNERTWLPNQTDPENMNVNYFFLNKYKCFQVIYRQTDQKTLYSTYLYNILKINMNTSLDNYLFSYRTNLSYNLVDYYILKKNMSYYCNWDFMSEIVHDRFQALRNPLLMFQKNLKRNDVKNYIYDLKEEYRQKFNYTTTLVPLFKEDQDLDREIRNDLFEDLIKYDVEPRESKQPINIDYKRTYFNLLLTYNQEPINRIYIKKVFFYGELKMTNKDDYLSLLVNLLNCLSVWFNLSLIDLAYAFGSLKFYLRRLFLSKWHGLNNQIQNEVDSAKQNLLVLQKTDQMTNIILIEKNQVYYLK